MCAIWLQIEVNTFLQVDFLGIYVNYVVRNSKCPSETNSLFTHAIVIANLGL
jgi:hypothetical protein